MMIGKTKFKKNGSVSNATSNKTIIPSDRERDDLLYYDEHLVQDVFGSFLCANPGIAGSKPTEAVTLSFLISLFLKFN